LELQRARRADTRDYLFQSFEKWEEMSKEWTLVLSMEFSTLDELLILTRDETRFNAFLKVFNFWDLLTKTIQDKAIDRSVAFEHYGISFVRYYDKYSKAMQEVDEIKGGFNNFQSFDWFHEEYLKTYPGEVESVKKRDEYFKKVWAQD
jgi:hypothetical protein